METPRPRAAELALFAGLFIALGLRVLDEPSLYYDEAWRILSADRPGSWVETVRPWLRNGLPDAVSFLHLLALRLLRGLHFSVVHLRVFGLLVGAAAVVAVRILGGRGGGAWTGRTAALLLVADSSWMLRSLEIKEYVWAAALLLFAGLRWESRLRTAARFGVIDGAMAAAAALLSPFAGLALPAAAAILYIAHRGGRSVRADAPLLVGLATAAAWLALQSVGSIRSAEAGDASARALGLGPGVFGRVTLSWESLRFPMEGLRAELGLITGPRGLNAVALPAWVLLSALAAAGARRAAPTARASLAVGGTALLAAVPVALLYGRFHAHYIIPLLPLFVVGLVGCAAAVSATRLARAVSGLLVVATATGWLGLYGVPSMHASGLDPLSRAVEARRGPDDAVVHSTALTFYPMLVLMPDARHLALFDTCVPWAALPIHPDLSFGVRDETVRHLWNPDGPGRPANTLWHIEWEGLNRCVTDRLAVGAETEAVRPSAGLVEAIRIAPRGAS